LAPDDAAGLRRFTDVRGANFVGSPQEVIEKILYQYELFGHQRFLLQFTVGSIAHDNVMRSIELLGTEVAPAVRNEIEQRTARADAAAPAGS
jgi:alkanesulfonate monooxygenase SsuD/methylene tetrahydromethanopterin reductase-like flavin-dependent oxidoreductase (luciferase family)